MKEQLARLWSLQSLDTILASAKKRLLAIPEDIAAAERALADADKKKKTALAEIEASRLARKKREGDIAANEAEILKFSGQLAQVKTNEQYKALEHEIEHLRTKTGTIEDEILGLLERDEELAGELVAAEKAVAAAVTGLEKTRIEAAEEEKALKAESEHLTEKRTAAAATIDKAVLAKYESIRKADGTIAMSRLVRDACETCYRQVPDQRQIEVRQAKNLVTCEGCGRILYQEDPE
ncbi:MAG: hypothetical protein HKN20_08905 [Gemmatimonadetes bacterium]|nr:hypothetical protein [Gemmatimonadota bacterium]